VTALGGYAATAITALTAQNTQGVHGVLPIEPAFIQQQMRVVLDDIGADAIKIGMLHDAAVIDAVSDVLDELGGPGGTVPVVVDPVMVAQSGDALLEPGAVQTLTRRLAIHATLLTPNLPEAERLSGTTIRDVAELKQAAEMLLTLGAKAVLLKGGHLAGDKVVDVLATEDEVQLFENLRIETEHLHGTGCTLASAIATGLAQGMELYAAYRRARAYLQEAIATAPRLGRGSGPVNHGHTVRDFPD
jgi:hydroxymethylpyrimidine/phosphomethylpyrimidine kinase